MLENKDCVVLGTDNDVAPRAGPWGFAHSPELDVNTDNDSYHSCNYKYSASEIDLFIKFIKENYKIAGFVFYFILHSYSF